MRTNTWCPRGRALSTSRLAILQGGSATQPKRKEGRQDHAHLPQRDAFPTTFVAVSPRELSAATMLRLGSLQWCHWPWLREPERYWGWRSDRCCASSALDRLRYS